MVIQFGHTDTHTQKENILEKNHQNNINFQIKIQFTECHHHNHNHQEFQPNLNLKHIFHIAEISFEVATMMMMMRNSYLLFGPLDI